MQLLEQMMSQLNESTEKSKCSQRIQVVAMSLLVFVGLLSERAFAHGFVERVSTPLSPPIEFTWWWKYAMFLLVVGTYLPLRMSLKWSRLFSAFFALFWTFVALPVMIVLITFPFIAIGYAPIAGPGDTYWGRTFAQVGTTFIFWNCFCLLLLMAGPIYFLRSTVKKVEKPKRLAYWSWLISIPLCFILGLTPYIVKGAWVHGWGGAYVVMKCQYQISDLHQALVLYALDNDNRLPVAKDYAELYPQIKPYLIPLHNQWHWHRTIDVCVIGDAWEHTPKPFIWNAEFSGREVFRTTEKDILEQDVTEPVVYFEPMRGGRFTILIVGGQWVDCPYTYQEYTFRPTYTPVVFLRRNIPQEKLERLRQYREPANSWDVSEP